MMVDKQIKKMDYLLKRTFPTQSLGDDICRCVSDCDREECLRNSKFDQSKYERLSYSDDLWKSCLYYLGSGETEETE